MDKLGVYHDGDFMARYIEDFEIPRLLIKPLFRYYEELRFNKKQARPAGSARFPLGLPENLLENITMLRIKDIAELNPDYVVTSDPSSYAALKKYWEKEKILSISEVLLKTFVDKKRY